MTTKNKLTMDLQLFAEKGDKEVETTAPLEEGFEYDPNFFTEHVENKRPEWLDDSDDEDNEAENTIPSEEIEETPENIKQDSKTNTAFADLRRQKKEFELEARSNDKWAVDNFGELGVTDFKTYRNMMDKQVLEQKQQDLEEKGYDVNSIHEAMKLDPVYKAMMESQPKEATIDEDRLMADYTGLQERYPDLVTKPEEISSDVWDRYDKGYDLIEAFEIVNKEKLNSKATKKTKEIARQETLNKLNSKKHLKTEKDNGGSGSDVYVDKATMAMYKEFGITEKQAIQFEKKMLNK